MGDAIARMMRALVARAAEGDTEALEQLQRVEDLSTQLLGQAVVLARSFGYSWAEVGAVLSITRQTAWERFHLEEVPQVWWTRCDCRYATLSLASRAGHENRCPRYVRTPDAAVL